MGLCSLFVVGKEEPLVSREQKLLYHDAVMAPRESCVRVCLNVYLCVVGGGADFVFFTAIAGKIS